MLVCACDLRAVIIVDRIMTKQSILATAGLAVGTVLFAAVPAHAGLLDGTLNNPSILANVEALITATNSDSQGSQNNNANTRADGNANNATGQHF
jgi:hypothetical protein